MEFGEICKGVLIDGLHDQVHTPEDLNCEFKKKGLIFLFVFFD